MCDDKCDEITQAAYRNACASHMFKLENGGFDGYLFSRHVKTDDHEMIDIDHSFIWAETPEGQDFWVKIQRELVV
ncbi:hypothetical protein D3C72_1813250 [compost metagenome]